MAEWQLLDKMDVSDRLLVSANGYCGIAFYDPSMNVWIWEDDGTYVWELDATAYAMPLPEPPNA